jgi:uncharacterized protein YuzE
MVGKLKIDYDEENDILWLHQNKKVQDSLELGNYVVDFSKNSILGLEIMDASLELSRLSSKQVSKDMLKNIQNAVLKVRSEKDLIFIVVLLKLDDAKVREIPIQVNAPRQVMMVKA